MRRVSVAALLWAGCTFEPVVPLDPPTSCLGRADGAPCSDLDRCTRGDRCLGGTCTATRAVACVPVDACHGGGACSPLTGLCAAGPILPDGTPCDDGDSCSAADVCVAGRCGGQPIECPIPPVCHAVAVCDPATGRCPPSELAPEGAPCDDADPCTVVDACDGEICRGVPLDCAADQCNAGACDPSTGACDGAALPDGTPCDDRSACTSDDRCGSGACNGAPIPCRTSDPCMDAICDPAFGCRIGARPEGAACDDANACTLGETCGGGRCGGGRSIVCSPDACHLPGACDPAIGCVYPNRPDGTLCEDGDLCTFDDACSSGSCVGTRLLCDPPTTCYVAGTCDAASGTCAYTTLPDGAGCNDGSACTRTDECTNGQCIGTDPIVFTGTYCQDGVCFTDRTLAAGIAWTATTSGTTMLGAGGAFLDYDGDGWLDILLGAERGPPALYRNLANGGFSNVSAISGMPEIFLPDRFMGFAVGDYDGDGDPDIYFLVYGPNILMRNEGDGTFTDVTVLAGVEDGSWSTAGAFGDYDADGDLDLYVGNYIAQSSFPNHIPHPNRLFRNEGNGTFTEVAAQLGVAGAGTTLAVTWSDFDADGDVDLFVCNDFGAFIEPNRLYRNDGGAFTDISAAAGADIAIYCMGITAGDYDADGDLDYYFSNLGRNVLLENRGPLGFADVTNATGTGLEHDACFTSLFTTSWGVGFHDFDRDTDVDLYVSNGFIPAARQIANAEDSPNALLRNDGGVFTDISASAHVENRRIGRGAAFGDYDRDGDVDVLEINVGGSPILYRNDSPGPGSHLTVDVVGRRSTRDAAGTRLEAVLGATTLVREVNRNYSFESSSDPAVHFGLGAAVRVDVLTARYTSGTVQTTYDRAANGRVSLVEPEVVVEQVTPPATAAPGAPITVTFVLRNLAPNPASIDWSLSTGGAGSSIVPPGGMVVVNATSTAPSTLGPVFVTVTAADAGGGLDQDRSTMTVQ